MSSYENQLFAAQVDKLMERTASLYESTKEVTWQQPQIVVECLEELRVALEELQVAEEELHQQNAELMMTRQAVEAERQRYQELFEFAPDGYIVTDLQGAIHEANRAAAQLLNVRQRHLVGKPFISFVPEEQRRDFRTKLNQLTQINRLQEWELQLVKRPDSLFEAALTVEVVRDYSNKPIGLRCLLRDISDRKATEAQLQQTQMQNLQLVEADRLKSQFLATMSHELRTPMNAILGFSDLLLRRFHNDSEPQLASMVERILRNGKHLLTMIEEILDFSKLQGNYLELRYEGFDLVELATSSIEDLRSLADQKALQLHLCSLQANIPIINDRHRLQQVITNLLSNAIKFTDEGSVTLELSELPEGRITISVRDTGIGIDPVDQEQIFQEFWQVNQTTTRKRNGTGLGLAITRSLVRLMQGSIAVESQLGQGSVFRIELPRQVNPVQP